VPVTGVFPAGVYLHLLETGIQAIQLSPYRADLPARRPIRLGTAAGFLACYFPRSPFQGQVSHQIQRHLLSIPARCAGDTTVRLMAHMICKAVGSAVQVREAARAGTLQAADKGAIDVVRRFGHLVSFAAMLLSRELGVEVRPALSRADVKEPGKRVQAAAAALAETGILSGGLRVPNAAATIEITADLRASRIRSAITVDAPGAGKPLTRLNWLLRQLRDTPGSVCIEAIARPAARHRPGQDDRPGPGDTQAAGRGPQT
jgi:hypothetical protein